MFWGDWCVSVMMFVSGLCESCVMWVWFGFILLLDVCGCSGLGLGLFVCRFLGLW